MAGGFNIAVISENSLPDLPMKLSRYLYDNVYILENMREGAKSQATVLCHGGGAGRCKHEGKIE